MNYKPVVLNGHDIIGYARTRRELAVLLEKRGILIDQIQQIIDGADEFSLTVQEL